MAMLLPSALSCDIIGPAARFSQSHCLPSRVSSSDLQASCRALQAALGFEIQSQTTSTRPVRPVCIQRNDPFGPQTNLSAMRPFSMALQPPKKRSRLEYEQDENSASNGTHALDTTIYQTPKRQRKIPDEIPRGLMASDFESLNTPVLPVKMEKETSPPAVLHMTSVETPAVASTQPLTPPKASVTKRRRPNVLTRLHTDILVSITQPSSSSATSSKTEQSKSAIEQASRQAHRRQPFISDQPVLASFLRSGRCRDWQGSSRQRWAPLTRRTTIA